MAVNQLNLTVRFFLVFLINIVLTSLVSATPKLADFTEYAQLPTIANMTISPSGERLAYRKTTDVQDLIVIYSVAQHKLVSAITLTETNRPRKLYFINENELILVVSNFERLAGYVNQTTVSNAYVFNIEKNQLRALLTRGDRVFPGQSSLGSIIGLTPDSKNILMSAFAGSALSIHDKEKPKYALFNIRIASPRIPQFSEFGLAETIDYFIDSQGNALVEERYNNTNNEHTIVAKIGDEWKTIYQKEVAVRDINVVGLSPDYQFLVFLDEDPQTGRVSYFNMALQDGSISASEFNREDADIDVVITDINRVVYGVRYAGFNPSYQFFDPQKTARLKAILARFPDNSVWLSSWSPDWKYLVVYVEGPNAPGDFFYFPLDDSPSFIASARPQIAIENIHAIAELSIKARDGLVIPTLLTIPNQALQNMKNLPAVMLPHGGPESYDRIGFDWLAQAIANEGYLVIQPQFRGSIGFGSKHRQAGFGEWGKKMQDDLNDSLAYLVDKHIVDPQRVCIVGASYGGYAALAAGAFSGDVYQCVVSVNGVADINRMLSSGAYNYGSKHWVVSYWQMLVAKGHASKASMSAISPANHATNFIAPTLLIHAENDQVVKISQSEQMLAALENAKKDVKFVELKNENHNLSTATGRAKTLEEIVTFLHAQLSEEKP